MKQVFKTVLVIGDNPDETIKLYSLDTQVPQYLKMKRDDAEKLQKQHIDFIEKVLNSDQIVLTTTQKDIYKNYYLDLKEMDEFEYYCNVTKGCIYDEVTGDAYSTTNPNAYFRYERCPQYRLEKTGEESDFSNPFKLKDGTISYSAKVDEIDWTLMHMYNTSIYEAAWEICVLGREPQDDRERNIKKNMENRLSYFNNFADKDEYVKHSCSFWTYGVATPEKYTEVDYKISDKEWVATYYDKFIKTLKGDELLTLYEVRNID